MFRRSNHHGHCALARTVDHVRPFVYFVYEVSCPVGSLNPFSLLLWFKTNLKDKKLLHNFLALYFLF